MDQQDIKSAARECALISLFYEIKNLFSNIWKGNAYDNNPRLLNVFYTKLCRIGYTFNATEMFKPPLVLYLSTKIKITNCLFIILQLKRTLKMSNYLGSWRGRQKVLTLIDCNLLEVQEGPWIFPPKLLSKQRRNNVYSFCLDNNICYVRSFFFYSYHFKKETNWIVLQHVYVILDKITDITII